MNCPLSFSPIAATVSIEETEFLFQQQLVNSRITRADTATQFGVEMNGIAISNTSLIFIKHHANYEVACGDIDTGGSIIFAFGCGPASSTSFNGQSYNIVEHGSIITKHSNVSHMRQMESGEVVLICSAEDIERRLQSFLDGTLSRELVFDRNIDMSGEIGSHAKATLLYVMSSLDANSALLDNPLIVASFEDLLAGVILSMPSSYSEELINPGKKLAAPGVVTRAEAFMAANAASPITIADVLLNAGCSRKALFSNFRRFRGYTPGDFLLNTRLNLAHERLANATESESVTSIAYSLGFSHMGRFSQVFRKRYGEKPSEVLKRSQRRLYRAHR
jgi:AraC-like DNA-binding protein